MATVACKSKILIADDSRVQRAVLTTFLEASGFTVVGASDGLEAVALFNEARPDLVILDITMPNMDGVEAARHMKASANEHYIPIVFMSSLDSEKHLNQCVAVGGDDFISKPFNGVMLLAKINSLLRVKELYQEQMRQKRALLKYQAVFEQEQLVAANLYKNILQADFVEIPTLRYILSPMALFNGDILLTAKAPNNQIYVLLGDFTGHGLSASVGAAPVADIFYGMVRKGFAAKDVIKEINRKLVKLLPVNMFLGATIISLKLDVGFLEMITCGLPEHYIVNRKTAKIRTIASQNVPLGILHAFDPKIQYVKVNEDDYVYLFTDGVIEAENTQGEQFGTEGVIACLKGDKGSYFDTVVQHLQQHSVGLGQQDDVTLVELQCNLSHLEWPKDTAAILQKQRIPMEWKSTMTFGVPTINGAHPVPIMINLLMDIQGLQRYQDVIYCILNELFINAVDYGLLALDPGLKQTNQGLIEYYQLKDERLAKMQSGEIQVSFKHTPIYHEDTKAVGGCLTIRVQDSGEGFDVDTVLSEQLVKQKGIGKAKECCTQLEYLGCGNAVKATFEWFL